MSFHPTTHAWWPRPDVLLLCTTTRCRPTGRAKKTCISSEFVRAGDGARTRDLKLGRLALYQLSYSRTGAKPSSAHPGARFGFPAARDRPNPDGWGPPRSVRGRTRCSASCAQDLQTGLGSYTELKHDTILYAKQAIVAEGEGPPKPPAPPRHWVEPDPVAFGRLGVVVKLLGDGLDARNLLADEERALLADVADMLARLRRLAENELGGRPISAEDNAWLDGFGTRLEALWVRSSDFDPATGQPGTTDQDAALVSDIFTATRSGALEVATGRVDDIWVLVPNDDGKFQLARGGVHSFYEFYRPVDQRLTDEEWRSMLDAGEAPARPTWQEVFLARR